VRICCKTIQRGMAPGSDLALTSITAAVMCLRVEARVTSFHATAGVEVYLSPPQVKVTDTHTFNLPTQPKIHVGRVCCMNSSNREPTHIQLIAQNFWFKHETVAPQM
jgi:hypothetical protein